MYPSNPPSLRRASLSFRFFFFHSSCLSQGHYSWSQGMGILGDKVQKSQEFVTFLPTSLLFICKRGNASLHSAQ